MNLQRVDAGVLDRLGEAEAALTQLPHRHARPAVVAGVRCVDQRLPYAWGTYARPTTPPDPVEFAEVRAWLDGRGDQWMVRTCVRHEAAPAYAGLRRWQLLGTYLLDAFTDPAPVPGFEVGPARTEEEFVAVFGADLAAMVDLTTPGRDYLVGRLDGEVVACARIGHAAGTSHLSAVNVLPSHRGRGLGYAISAAATRTALAASAAPDHLVWLHAQPHLARFYGRLGYHHVTDHVLLAPPTVTADPT